jgi:hypothetical protein
MRTPIHIASGTSSPWPGEKRSCTTMSTGTLIAFVVVAMLIVGLLVSLVPGLRDAARRRAEERELVGDCEQRENA